MARGGRPGDRRGRSAGRDPTDKATVEIPSRRPASSRAFHVGEGEVVPVGTVLVSIGGDGAAPPTVAGEPPRQRPRTCSRNAARAQGRQELGVDIDGLVGTGPGAHHRGGRARGRLGRCSRRRSKAAARRPPGDRRAHGAGAPGSAAGYLGGGVRLRVGGHGPARGGVVKACADELQAFPELNARLEQDAIVYLERYDIGVAVQTPQGLMVPVVRGCDAKSSTRSTTSWRRWRSAGERASWHPRSSVARRSPSRAPASSAGCSRRRSSTTRRSRFSPSAASATGLVHGRRDRRPALRGRSALDVRSSRDRRRSRSRVRSGRHRAARRQGLASLQRQPCNARHRSAQIAHSRGKGADESNVRCVSRFCCRSSGGGLRAAVATGGQPPAKSFTAVLTAEDEVPLCAAATNASRGHFVAHVVDATAGTSSGSSSPATCQATSSRRTSTWHRLAFLDPLSRASANGRC